MDSLDLIPTDRIQYHRSCYESYTSKINLEKIEPVEAQMNASACGLVRTSEYICVKTRSMTAPFDWSQDGHHLSSSQQLKIRYISPFCLP
jgi:hypothetical protein